jgi:hypothetical protein
MASFTRQKRYYRLIGQLSIIQIFFMFLPAIALMIYSLLFEFLRGNQLFYLGIDSLFLVTYATIVIIITLTQREKVLYPKELFNWTEICRCCVDSDDEKMYEHEENDGNGAVAPDGHIVKVMSASGATLESGDENGETKIK